MRIRLHIDVETDEPILLAGWPGMGNVGIGAVDFLRRQLQADPIGEIDMSDQFTPDAIVVEEGIAKLPEMPANSFSYSSDNDLLFFMSEAQVSGPAALTLTNMIVDLAEKMDVRRIFTCAAFAVPISYTEEARVLGVATEEDLRDSLTPHGAEILQQGIISGLNGLLLGVAGGRGIDSACLLATIPQYAMSLPNPRGSRAIVNTLATILGLDLDLAGFEPSVSQMDGVMAQVEERMRAAFDASDADVEPLEEEAEEQPPPADENEVPNYVMKRIEYLFAQVSRDRDRASQLKEELDRWGLYELYEDRFLDLFRSGGESDET
jgi:proteasome assembly chaperone (PAC2) family protein